MKNVCRLTGGILGVLGILVVGPSSSMPGRATEKGITQGLSAQQICALTGECQTFTTCGASTFEGAFIQQKPNNVCVYACTATRQCTSTTCCPDGECTSDNFTREINYRVRVDFPAGACPGDADTARAFCALGEPAW